MPAPSFSALPSVNARLFAFAGQLRRRGHTVLIAGAAELQQVAAPPSSGCPTTLTFVCDQASGAPYPKLGGHSCRGRGGRRFLSPPPLVPERATYKSFLAQAWPGHGFLSASLRRLFSFDAEWGLSLLQVDLKHLDAIVVVKTLGKAFEAVKGAGVPLVWVSTSPAPRLDHHFDAKGSGKAAYAPGRLF